MTGSPSTQHAQPDLLDEPESAQEEDRSVVPAVDRPVGAEPVDGIGTNHSSVAGREAMLSELARRVDPGKFSPTVVLHVHISDPALTDDPGAHDSSDSAGSRHFRQLSGQAEVARVEGLGRTLLSTVRRWLGTGCIVKLQPVVDPSTMPAVDSYEVPQRMVEALLTRAPTSAFPWSGNSSRRMDVDHTIPYLHPPGTSPGQTGMHNLGLLSRREHRFKTFGGVTVRQPVPGTYVWRTCCGRVIITNPAGTHDLGAGAFADALWSATIQHQLVKAA